MTLSHWTQEHPWQALRHGLWLLLNAGLGAAAGGTLAWGPLGGDRLLQLGLALAGGLLATIIATRPVGATIRGQTQTARRWWRLLVAGHLLILLGIGGLAAVQFYQTGFFPPVGQTRIENFDHLGEALANHYAFADVKDVDVAALHAHYRPLVAAAETNDDYHAVVAEMLAELNDAHTGLVDPPPAGGTFAFTQEIEGHAVVAWSSLAGQAVGLEPGAIVETIDGRTVPQQIAWLAEWDPRLVSGSTARQRHARAFLNLLRVPAAKPVDVTYRAPDGSTHTTTLSWAEAPDDPYANYPRTITGRELPGGAFLIRIPTFAGNDADPVATFDALLDAHIDAPGLIIDLRGNSGGTTAVADPIAGRLVADRTVYGYERYRTRLPRFGWRLERTATLTPRRETYTGPVVLLVDALTMSTGETFALSLADPGRAQTVGRPTAGASGNPTPFRLVGGGRARYSLGIFRRLDGSLLEGAGLQPDLPVTWTLDDARPGRDPDVAAAESLLGLTD